MLAQQGYRVDALEPAPEFVAASRRALGEGARVYPFSYRRIGRALAALRGKPDEATDRLSYRPHSGFAYTFTRQQVERLAAGVGRSVSWEPGTSGGFECVTFLPPD